MEDGLGDVDQGRDFVIRVEHPLRSAVRPQPTTAVGVFALVIAVSISSFSAAHKDIPTSPNRGCGRNTWCSPISPLTPTHLPTN